MIVFRVLQLNVNSAIHSFDQVTRPKTFYNWWMVVKLHIKLVYLWHEKVKLVVPTLSLSAGRCAADGARGKAGSFPTSREDSDMSNAPNHLESLVDGQLGYAKWFQMDYSNMTILLGRHVLHS